MSVFQNKAAHLAAGLKLTAAAHTVQALHTTCVHALVTHSHCSKEPNSTVKEKKTIGIEIGRGKKEKRKQHIYF